MSIFGPVKLKRIFLFACLFSVCGLKAQDKNFYDDIMGVVFLDSVTVTATKGGFKVADFIQLVREDTSFYLAFRNLRRANYTSENQIKFYNSKLKLKASYDSQIRQYAWGNCRSMEVLREHVFGKLYDRKQNYKFYTAIMFDYLFFTHDTVCIDFWKKVKPEDMSHIEKHKQQLKTALFNPGQVVENIPLAGKKMAIFSADNSKYYDYKIRSTTYKDSIECYVFEVRQSDSSWVDDNDAVVKHLSTYFNKKDFKIVARNYHLAFRSVLFDFDVTIDIRLRSLGEHLIVEYLSYDGFFDIPLRKPEIARFEVDFDVQDIVD